MSESDNLDTSGDALRRVLNAALEAGQSDDEAWEAVKERVRKAKASLGKAHTEAVLELDSIKKSARESYYAAGRARTSINGLVKSLVLIAGDADQDACRSIAEAVDDKLERISKKAGDVVLKHLKPLNP